MIQDAYLKMGRMNCNGCVSKITKILQSFHGLEIVQVDLAAKTVTVRYESDRLNFEEVEQALAQAKYPIVEILQERGTR
ncbi:heavy-metal-associated domain-containing protein [Dictyobacter aurantiacus]|uniref:HMA domain-containing protein n=1 Tax=Dictyobacter aurantiacus TaxID=1936993 RepID=A0A401ZM90_9CHLR|nr:heavy-metal-associated domain-containing protein [Dictyobacter aurantiacus]GCE07952.1 hypothetical protein KDAU_52810 [Dictyobacter aurantiacus]